MRLSSEQLLPALQRQLASLYLISGDEPLLVEESCEHICQNAKQAGYVEQQILTVDSSFDWYQLHLLTHHLSLFSSKQFIELRFNTTKMTSVGNKALEAYIAQPSPDAIVVLRMPKLDSSTQASAWLKALDKKGVIVRIWLPNASQMPRWIVGRLQKAGLETTEEGVQLLAERNSGNLLAAVQDIEKLRLRFGKGKIETKAIADVVIDNASFDIFQWVDSILNKQSRQIVRILMALRAAGVEPLLVLWALTRELRKLEKVSLLQRAQAIDLMIKGAKPGNVWDELLQLGLATAGVHYV